MPKPRPRSRRSGDNIEKPDAPEVDTKLETFEQDNARENGDARMQPDAPDITPDSTPENERPSAND